MNILNKKIDNDEFYERQEINGCGQILHQFQIVQFPVMKTLYYFPMGLFF